MVTYICNLYSFWKLDCKSSYIPACLVTANISLVFEVLLLFGHFHRLATDYYIWYEEHWYNFLCVTTLQRLLRVGWAWLQTGLVSTGWENSCMPLVAYSHFIGGSFALHGMDQFLLLHNGQGQHHSHFVGGFISSKGVRSDMQPLVRGSLSVKRG